MITLASGSVLVMKLGALALTTAVTNSLLDAADKKDWIIRINIVAGVVAVIVIYSGVVKQGLDLATTFMHMVE